MANKKATRESYGEALALLADENKDVVVLDADLSKSTKTELFQKKAPEKPVLMIQNFCDIIKNA